MRLNELFDKAEQWKVGTNAPSVFEAFFETPDGDEFKVRADSFSPMSASPRKWTVEFLATQDANKLNPHELTGRGNELVVFSTVMEIMQAMIKQHPDDVFTFKAEEANRKALYSRMIKRFIKPPLGYAEVDGRYVIGQDEVVQKVAQQFSN